MTLVSELAVQGLVMGAKAAGQAIEGQKVGERKCPSCRSQVYKKGFGVLWGFHWCYFCTRHSHAGGSGCAWTQDSKDDIDGSVGVA